MKRLLQFYCVHISMSDLEMMKNHKKAMSAAAAEHQGMAKSG
jgi:hypothetical protein